jgi:hypothetical protein
VQGFSIGTPIAVVSIQQQERACPVYAECEASALASDAASVSLGVGQGYAYQYFTMYSLFVSLVLSRSVAHYLYFSFRGLGLVLRLVIKKRSAALLLWKYLWCSVIARIFTVLEE